MSDRRKRPFRFSVQAFEADSGQQWISVARRAEDLGYSTLFTTDHYFGPGDISNASGHRPVDVAPLTAMTAAAMATTRLRVGCRVFCVDYHNPVVLAKELATLDMLSEGRLEAGLGAGLGGRRVRGARHRDGPPRACGSNGWRRSSRFSRRTGAGSRSMSSARTCAPSGFAGRPLPVQQPHPPIFIGGGAPRILKLAGRLADIVSINFNNAAGKLGAGSVASSTRDATAEKISWIAGRRRRPLRRHRTRDRRLLRCDQRGSPGRPGSHGAAVQRHAGGAVRASARADRLRARGLREARATSQRTRRQLHQRRAALHGSVRAGRCPACGQLTTGAGQSQRSSARGRLAGSPPSRRGKRR